MFVKAWFLPNKEMTVYAISTILVLKHEYSVTARRANMMAVYDYV